MPKHLCFLELKKCHNNSTIPKYATLGSSGMDLYSVEDVILKPQITTIIPTGIKISIPEGYEGQIRSRSGFSSKNNVILVNSIGTIDSDYIGELKIAMFNLNMNKEVEVKQGQAIAQLVICPILRAILNILPEGQELKSTSRGEGGFGSSS